MQSVHISTVDLEEIVFVFWAVEHFLLWWNEVICIGLDILYCNYLMVGVFFP